MRIISSKSNLVQGSHIRKAYSHIKLAIADFILTKSRLYLRQKNNDVKITTKSAKEKCEPCNYCISTAPDL